MIALGDDYIIHGKNDDSVMRIRRIPYVDTHGARKLMIIKTKDSQLVSRQSVNDVPAIKHLRKSMPIEVLTESDLVAHLKELGI